MKYTWTVDMKKQQTMKKGVFRLKQMDVIKDFVMANIIPSAKKTDIGYEDSLIEAGIIDSLAIVKVISFLEKEFKIRIDDEDIFPENFDSIKAMNFFVDAKQRQN